MVKFHDIFSAKAEKKKEEIVKVIADIREKNSPLISELFDKGVEVEFKHLPVADFLIKDVAIERKTVSDFISSTLNKRLIRQLEEIKQYPKPLLIVEGIEEQELYNDRDEGINGNAIRGFLLSILLKHEIPIIFTKDYEDSAKFIYILAKKQKKKDFSWRVKKKALSKKERLRFILEGFPGIGPSTAKKLLKKYKTIKNIVNIPIEELRSEIGKKAEIFRLLIELY